MFATNQNRLIFLSIHILHNSYINVEKKDKLKTVTNF